MGLEQIPLGHALWEQWEAREDAVAVEEVPSGRTFTYGQLQAASSFLARYLSPLLEPKGSQGPCGASLTGHTRAPVVATCFEPSHSLVVAQVALLRLGCAFVPLDTTHPPERLGFILRDSGCQGVLCSEAVFPQLQASLGELCTLGELVSPPDRWVRKPGDPILSEESAACPKRVWILSVPPIPATWKPSSGADRGVEPIVHLADTEEDPLSHLIYTSGTTGEPKVSLVCAACW